MISFIKGEEIVVKGVRFVIACVLRRHGLVVLRLKVNTEKEGVAGGEK